MACGGLVPACGRPRVIAGKKEEEEEKPFRVSSTRDFLAAESSRAGATGERERGLRGKEEEKSHNTGS